MEYLEYIFFLHLRNNYVDKQIILYIPFSTWKSEYNVNVTFQLEWVSIYLDT